VIVVMGKSSASQLVGDDALQPFGPFRLLLVHLPAVGDMEARCWARHSGIVVA
jgi:hypothetical protein